MPSVPSVQQPQMGHQTGDTYRRIAEALRTLRDLGERRETVLVELLKEIQSLPPDELRLLWSTVQTATKVQAAVTAETMAEASPPGQVPRAGIEGRLRSG